MKEAIVKVNLISGEPKIGMVDIIDDTIQLELIVTGVEENNIKLEATKNSLRISLKEAFKYTKAFDFELKSEVLQFRAFDCYREDGVLTIYIPIIKDVNYSEVVKLTI